MIKEELVAGLIIKNIIEDKNDNSLNKDQKELYEFVLAVRPWYRAILGV